MPVIRMLASAFALTFLFVGLMHGQDSKTPLPLTTKDQIIKSADLQSDVAVLRKAYEALHPGLYRYNTKTEMDAHFAALESKLSHDLSLQDAYLAFSIFAARVRCGHTYPNFFNQRKAVAAALFQGQNRVPFYFTWMDRRMIVTRDFTPDHLLPRGTRVFSINGAPAEAILAQLMTIARQTSPPTPGSHRSQANRGEYSRARSAFQLRLSAPITSWLMLLLMLFA